MSPPNGGLYVHRKVLNAAQLRSWAEAQGLPPLDEDLHLTVLYSATPDLVWNPEDDSIEAEVEGAGVLGADKAVVLFVECLDAEARHWYARSVLGAECTYPNYRPHVTLYYGGAVPAEPPEFALVLGPEVVVPLGNEEALSASQMQKAMLDTADAPTFDERPTLAQKAVGRGYNPNRGAGGRFTSGTGVGTGYTQDGKGTWRTAGGAKAPAAVAARLKELRIPPATKDVRLNPDPKGHLLAVGRDAKGRPYSKYSAAFEAKQAAAKFERLKAFNKVLPKLREAISRDLRSGDPATQDVAAVLKLIDKTGFRPGSMKNTKAKVQAYGASTLRAEHVTITGDRMRFQFTGKKGVPIQHEVQDAQLAAYLRPRKAAGGRLFNVNENGLRLYIKKHAGARFMTKDFRTWNATNMALQLVNKMAPVTSEAAFKKARMAVAKQVSAHLGNTPAMALKAYIDPTVWGRIRRRTRG